MTEGITVIEIGQVVLEDRPLQCLPNLVQVDGVGEVGIGAQRQNTGIGEVLNVRKGVKVLEVRVKRRVAAASVGGC